MTFEPGTRIRLTDTCPWPERVGQLGRVATVPSAERHMYPNAGLGRGEVIVLLDEDPIATALVMATHAAEVPTDPTPPIGELAVASGWILDHPAETVALLTEAGVLLQVGWFTPGMPDGPSVGGLLDGKFSDDDQPVYRVSLPTSENNDA